MAHGACPTCGSAYEECEGHHTDSGEGLERPARPFQPRAVAPGATRTGPRLIPGDWVRVRRGELRGASGRVEAVDRTARPALVTFRQRNLTVIRLPLGLLEFVGYRGEEPDVL